MTTLRKEAGQARTRVINKIVRLMTLPGDPQLAALCTEAAARLATQQPKTSVRKSPAALLSLAGLRPADEVAKALTKDGFKHLSTFLGSKAAVVLLLGRRPSPC